MKLYYLPLFTEYISYAKDNLNQIDSCNKDDKPVAIYTEGKIVYAAISTEYFLKDYLKETKEDCLIDCKKLNKGCRHYNNDPWVPYIVSIVGEE